MIRTYYFILSQIIKKYSENPEHDRQILHTTFKQFYKEKYQRQLESLKDFENEDLIELINCILTEFAVEYGIFLIGPNEPENAEELSLAEFLEACRWIEDNEAFYMATQTFELPDGYKPVPDLNALKRLKKGKRKWTEENIELDFGQTIYLFSFRNYCYFKKTLSPYTPVEKLDEYIKKGLVYGKF